MHRSGLAAFRSRDEKDARRYSFESRPAALPPAFARKFRARARAWSFFEAQPPWYRRTSIFWVMSAKREETRVRRLDDLIARSAKRTPIRALATPAKPRPDAPRKEKP